VKSFTGRPARSAHSMASDAVARLP